MTVIWKKAVIFGICGAIGGIIGMLAGEVIHSSPSANYLLSILQVSIWSSAVASGIAIVLSLGQDIYLRRWMPSWRKVRKAVIGGIIAGGIGGGVAQALYGGLGASEPLRIGCWGIMGLLLGVLLSKVIPNLPKIKAGIGGGIGGAIGGLIFIALSGILPEIAGRLAGGFVIGFSIGVMLTIAEATVRDAWLEIIWGPKESSTILLGETPIVLGSSSEAHIHLKRELRFPPVAAKIVKDQDRIIYKDQTTGHQQDLRNGSQLRIGNLMIEVRTRK